MIRRGWRLYRASARQLLVVALLPEVLRTLLAIPGLMLASRAVEGMVDVFADYIQRAAADPDAYRYADAALEAEIQDRLRVVLVPLPEVAAATAVLAACALAVSLVGASAISYAALGRTSNRSVSAFDAFGTVFARPALIRPIGALSIASLASALVPLALQGSAEFQAWSGEPGSPRSLLLGGLISVAGLVLAVGIVVLAVRWAMYIPAVLNESLGVGAGLARAAALSRGIRSRLFLAIAGLVSLQALSSGIVAATGGLVMGVAAQSVVVGFATYVAISAFATLLWAPVLPAVLAQAYLTRTSEKGRADGDSPG
jgi:hypothetical protein